MAAPALRPPRLGGQTVCHCFDLRCCPWSARFPGRGTVGLPAPASVGQAGGLSLLWLAPLSMERTVPRKGDSRLARARLGWAGRRSVTALICAAVHGAHGSPEGGQLACPRPTRRGGQRPYRLDPCPERRRSADTPRLLRLTPPCHACAVL